MLIRSMLPAEEAAVRHLYAACHAHWPARSLRWYQAYPTLVAVEDGLIVGFTSYSVSSYSGMVTVGGQDLCVLPEAQGTGIGLALHLERCAIGADVGAHMFTGLTQENNHAMIAIFKKCGYHRCQDIGRAFPDGDGVIYLGALR
jgi:GNAT superfamily N-acetyltransferase